jgi:IS1 family transposase
MPRRRWCFSFRKSQTFTLDSSSKIVQFDRMNKLSTDERTRIVAALVEGNSMRAVSRMTGIARNTINKLLVDLGTACSEYQDKAFRNLSCKRVQCDEIWSFVGAKEKNATTEKKQEGWGDVWTWVAMDADTKLVPCWFVGQRDAGCAYHFMHDLAGRLANRVQLTTDGHKAYLYAVEDAFGADIDYAMLIKIYGNTPEGGEVRYSPAVCMGAKKAAISGKPDFKHVSTSFVERQNLTMRMSMRRFTRLTNGFSKKVENHEHMLALHYMFYNFGRIHQSLRVTPAMEAGVSDHVWELEEIISLLD